MMYRPTRNGRSGPWRSICQSPLGCGIAPAGVRSLATSGVPGGQRPSAWQRNGRKSPSVSRVTGTAGSRASSPPSLGFAPGVKVGEPTTVDLYPIFISSASDVDEVRKRVKRVIEDAINPPLGDRVAAQLFPDMWERASAQVAPGRTINEMFVERAVAAAGVLVLLKTRVGRGMREEVEAVLAVPAPGVHLAVLRFTDRERAANQARMDAFVRRLGRGNVLYDHTGAPGSEQAWLSIIKALTGFALAVLDKTRERENTFAP
jgi:hypothetical protein